MKQRHAKSNSQRRSRCRIDLIGQVRSGQVVTDQCLSVVAGPFKARAILIQEQVTLISLPPNHIEGRIILKQEGAMPIGQPETGEVAAGGLRRSTAPCGPVEHVTPYSLRGIRPRPRRPLAERGTPTRRFTCTKSIRLRCNEQSLFILKISFEQCMDRELLSE